MKKKFFTLLVSVLSVGLLQAQTWNGSTSTNWNTGSNWTPAAVPISTSNVIIPTGLATYPVLASNVTINSMDMRAGSRLDFNGFTFTISAVNSYNYFTGATLNNSNASTDIVLNLNTGSNGYHAYFRSTTVNDNITFNLSGSNIFYEADNAGTANTFTGNANFNVSSTLGLYLSYSVASQYNGNLTVTRTGAGTTDLFEGGATVSGNFSLTNSIDGNTYLGSLAKRTSIAGTVNISLIQTTPLTFQMYRMINQTNGGSISVQNSRGFDVQRDTLKVAFMSITGYRGNDFGTLYNNDIVGNLTIADDASFTNGYHTYLRSNIITGNATITNNGFNNINDADATNSGNRYTGNVSFTATGTGDMYISHGDTSEYGGSLIISRTGRGITQAFNSGGIVGGNFSFSNNTTGNALFGNVSRTTSVGGTINISLNDTLPNSFQLHRIINQTNGGSISVQNSRGFDVQRDTLKVASMSITGYRGNDFGYLYNNDITGNLTIADDASFTSGYHTYLRSNIITGNATITNNGFNSIYDADATNSGNHYTGNVSFTATGSGGMALSNGDTSTYDGNLTISRTGAGVTQAFNSGAIIGGNFSFTNNTAGNTLFGNVTRRTSVGGTVTVSINNTTPGSFQFHRIVNQVNGGSISVQNSLGFDVQQDTLKLASMSITGYRGNNFGTLYNNDIAGNLTIADDASFTNGYHTYLRSNIITGNATITNNGSNNIYDADATNSGNHYTGNVSYTRNGGPLFIGGGDTTDIGGNLTLSSASGITLTKIKFIGNADATIEQILTQPIAIDQLVMGKSGSGKVTLNDSVTVTNSAAFISGNLYSSAGKELVFPNNIVSHTSTSAASHVVGPVTKEGDDIFTFPVGGPLSYNPVTISAPVGATSRFKAEYKNQNPTIDGFNTNSKAASFGAATISNAGYWDVQRLLGSTNVTLRLGFNANPYEQYPNLANLKVAHWNGTQWDDHGNGGTSGTPASGTVVNAVPITSFSPFTIAGVVPTYFFSYGQPGAGPDGSPVKLKGIGGYPNYQVKQLPAGSYTSDSIFLIPNGTAATFRLKDANGVEKDTTITAPVAPTNYITANGSGTVNFTGWRHFVYLRDAGNNIIGAIKDNDLTLGNTTMTTYFSTANVATSPNGNIFLKRSFKITSQFAPAGTKRVRFYIAKTEFNNLVAASPASFPNGINSLTITKYTGPQEDSLFNPIPGGNAVIIPNSDITIADLGSMYSLDINVTSFSSFYIGGNNSNLNVCSGSTITLSSNITGSSYQWQVNTGSGFVNISNSGSYSGTGTAALTITNAPQNLYGYQFRAVVNGSTFSQVYTLKFNTSWEGTVSTAWENPANWSCNTLPDANTDVIINAGKSNYPQLNSNATIRSLRLNNGVSGTVKSGFTLTILK